MTTSPGKKPPPADDGFNDTAGEGLPDPTEPEPHWIESTDNLQGMFAETARAAEEPGYEVRTPESDGGPVEMQEQAADPSVAASIEAYEEAQREKHLDVEAPVLAEHADAPDPYEFKDDDSGTGSWVEESSTNPSWHDSSSEHRSLKAPEPTPAPQAKPAAKPAASPSASGSARATPPPKPASPTPSSSSAKAAPPAKPASSTPSGTTRAASPTPSGSTRAATPAKPATPSAPSAGRATPAPKPGKKGFDIDDLFNRAKEIKKDDKKSPPPS